MKRAAAIGDSGRIHGAEARPRARWVTLVSALSGNERFVGARKHAALTSVLSATFLTVLVQGALTFQKYRFDKGLMVGTTMAAISWSEIVARRKNLRPSRLSLFLVATVTTVLMVTLQQGARVLAAGLPLTHS